METYYVQESDTVHPYADEDFVEDNYDQVDHLLEAGTEKSLNLHFRQITL